MQKISLTVPTESISTTGNVISSSFLMEEIAKGSNYLWIKLVSKCVCYFITVDP